MKSTSASPLSEVIRKSFPRLSSIQRTASSLYGIMSFDGNDTTTDEDLERGMAAAAAIAERSRKACRMSGLMT
jgi:hypothetical protein